MVEVQACITEERFKNFIKSIFAEQFQKQEKNIINIISGHFEITMKEIKDLKVGLSDLIETVQSLHTQKKKQKM